MTATTSSQEIYADAMNYSTNTVCYYQITAGTADATLYGLISVEFDYYFAASVYIINGDTMDSATNLTIPNTTTTYLFPALTSTKGISNVWIVLRPDIQTEILAKF